MSRSSRSALLLVTATVAGLLTAVAGHSAASAAAPASTTPGAFVGLTPARVLDTRSGNGAPQTPAVNGKPLHVTVAGRGGVPTDASAVVLTLTVVGTNAGGYLTAYPTGGSRPTASVVNWATGQTVAGSATVTLGTGGAIDLVVAAGRPVDLVADVSGYLVAGVPTAAGAYVARTPTRVLDTRTGVGVLAGPLTPADQTYVQMLGAGGVIPSSGVSAVVGTLTAVGSKTSGYLTAWPDGDRPTVSSLNYATGQTVANQVTVPLGTAGGFSLFTSGGPVDVLFDVTGYVIEGTATAPGTYVPIAPNRIYDTRRGGAVPAPGSDNNTVIAGRGGIPRTGVGAVVANLTATNTTSSGYLTVWPAGQALPLASNLNWTTGRTVANQASLILGRGGVVDLHLAGATRADVIIDVSGYYLPGPIPTPTGLTATVTAPGTPRQTVSLSWNGPADPAVGYTVRRAVGTVAPTAPDLGDAGPVVADGSHAAVDGDVQPGTTYSYAVFSHDDIPNYSAAAATVTVTLPVIDPTPLGLGTPTTLPLPAGAPVTAFTLVRDIDCPVDGTCVGVGQITSSANDVGPYVLLERNGSWSAPTVPVPGDAEPASVATLRSVDCYGTASCVAAGDYLDTAGRSRPMIVRLAGDVLTATGVALPAVASVSSLAVRDIVCVADSTCLVVGSYRSTAGVVPLSLVIDDDGIRIAPSTVDVGVSGAQPASVACSGPTSCVAVGLSGSVSGRTAGLTGRWDGTRWEYHALARPTGIVATESVTLLAVACQDATHCVATGTGSTAANGAVGLRIVGDGVTWTATVLRDVPSTTYGGYVQCRPALGCLTAYRTPGSTRVVTDDGTHRTVPSADGLAATPTSTYDLACDAGLRCALAGTWDAGVTVSRPRAMVTAVADGVPTSYQVGPAVPPSVSAVVVNHVGCSPSGSCLLTGYTNDSSGHLSGFLQTFTLS